jgi:lipooligosaccharide transport system permease protein
VFLAPALLVSAALQGTMDEVTFPTLHGFMWAKTFFGMNSTGLTAKHISHGVLLSALLRTVVTVGFYWVILWFADAFMSPHAWLAMPISLFAGASFGAFMMAITALIKDDDGFLALIGRFIIAPMFLFSGTFYPLSTLPLYLQWIGWVSPLWHATELCRWVTFDYPIDSLMLLVHFGFLLIIGVVGLTWSKRIFTKRLAA